MPTTALVGASTAARMAGAVVGISGVTAGPAGFGLAAASAAMHAGLPPPSTLSDAMNGDAVTSLPAPDTTPMELEVTASADPVTCTLTVRDARDNARPGRPDGRPNQASLIASFIRCATLGATRGLAPRAISLASSCEIRTV
jgi:hypothetical protein